MGRAQRAGAQLAASVPPVLHRASQPARLQWELGARKTLPSGALMRRELFVQLILETSADSKHAGTGALEILSLSI